MELRESNGPYTYHDYLTWPDDERWELIDGVPYTMSPSPTFRYQQAVFHLSRLLGNALMGKHCVAGCAPMDVILSECDIVQPDLFIVCDHRKIANDGIHGSPDVIFEVLSPSTERKDRLEKKRLYEKYDVKEYILVNVDGRFVESYLLGKKSKYGSEEILGEEGILKLHSLNDLPIPVREIFILPLTDVAQ